MKIHPRYLAWFTSDGKCGTLTLHSNLLKNHELIKNFFVTLHKVENIYFENPHIELYGTNHLNIIKDIQHIQRTVGALCVTAWEYFKIEPNSMVQTVKLTKDEKLAIFEKLIREPEKPYFSPLEKLCIVDCYLIYKNLTTPQKITARVINAE